MLWSAKGYDQEELQELCRKVPSLCEDVMWCNPNCVWVGFGAMVAVCLILILVIYLAKKAYDAS